MTLRAYLEGYRAALTTVALAFGLSPAIIKMPALSDAGPKREQEAKIKMVETSYEIESPPEWIQPYAKESK